MYIAILSRFKIYPAIRLKTLQVFVKLLSHPYWLAIELLSQLHYDVISTGKLYTHNIRMSMEHKILKLTELFSEIDSNVRKTLY